MHQFWLKAGRFYQATKDEQVIFNNPASSIIKKDSVVFCVKVTEIPNLGKFAVLEDYWTDKVYGYQFRNRPERINFVAINPSILENAE